MAEVRPLRAVHYNLAAIPSLAAVTAPPYDVIDAAKRDELAARSPFNVVEIDLPQGDDPYAQAAETMEAWTLEGILSADREPAIWALSQDYTAPGGERRTRRGFFARVRLAEYGPGAIRPHERTQPGPKEDRLNLTRATRHNLSAIFSLYEGDAWSHLDGATSERPWGEVTDEEGTVHRVWRIADPAVHAAIAAELEPAELLIADGHHRYETARAYEREIGGEGAHNYTLMCLVSLEDPGLTVFPTHRLLALDGAKREALHRGIDELFEVTEVDAAALVPENEPGVGVFGLLEAEGGPRRLHLRDAAAAEEALAGNSDAYRRLDSAVLEALVLRGILGMSERDIAEKRGIGYAKSVEEARRLLGASTYQAAFFLRPTPVDQVREVAAAGETMPPKSTYFFPKLLTGLLFNPLS